MSIPIDSDFQQPLIPQNANHNCPGTQDKNAGNADACDGCPNQQICQTRPKGQDPDLPEISVRMNQIKHKILVLSGKGGVGKSTIATQLAFYISKIHRHNFHDFQDSSQSTSSSRSNNIVDPSIHTHLSNFSSDSDDSDDPDGLYDVGLLDLDICGPSVPTMTGTSKQSVAKTTLGWSPVYPRDNLAVMSVGFLLQKPDSAVIFRGPRKNALVKQFLKDVYWTQLDYLIIDTPPGTTDEHLSIASLMNSSEQSLKAVIVSTPQNASLSDVKRTVQFCRKGNIKIIGIIENMSYFVCPKCTKTSIIFPSSIPSVRQYCNSINIKYLGALPISESVSKAGDSGSSFQVDPVIDSSFVPIVRQILQYLQQT